VSAHNLKQFQTSFGISDNLPSILVNFFEATSNGVMIADTNNTIIAINPAFTRITGYETKEAIGNKSNILNSGRQNKSFYTSMWNELNIHGRWEGEIWNRRKDGEIFPEWLSITSVKDRKDNVQCYVGTFSDISSIKTSEDKLIQLAFYDPLTCLPNRVLFHDRLNHTLAHAKRKKESFAVYFIDLDGFKQVNDSYGHLIGDNVLLETARRLKESVRASDTVARLAGDEFTIIADKISNPADIATVAKKAIDAMTEDFHINGHKISCGISIGAAVYPESATDAETLLERADAAMYEVKKAGKHGFRVFTTNH